MSDPYRTASFLPPVPPLEVTNLTDQRCRDHPRSMQPDPLLTNCYICGKKLPSLRKRPNVLSDVQDASKRVVNNLQQYSNANSLLLTISTFVTLSEKRQCTFYVQPECTFIPRRLFTNAVAANMFMIRHTQLSNVSPILGSGVLDAHMAYKGVGMLLENKMRVSPAQRVGFEVEYTGFLPVGYPYGMPFEFVLALRGPSAHVG